MGVGLDEVFLGEVVAQFFIAQGLVKEKTPDGRLILPDQGVESPLIAKNHDLCNQRYVVQLTHFCSRCLSVLFERVA